MASIIWEGDMWPLKKIPFRNGDLRGTQTENIRHIIAKGNIIEGIEAIE